MSSSDRSAVPGQLRLDRWCDSIDALVTVERDTLFMLVAFYADGTLQVGYSDEKLLAEEIVCQC